MGILARRKKGKTALLQRFFYYRIPEERITKTLFAESFYRRLLTQYFAFTTRTPEWTDRVHPLAKLKDLAANDEPVAVDIEAMEDIPDRVPGQAWSYAREAVTGSRRAGTSASSRSSTSSST